MQLMTLEELGAPAFLECESLQITGITEEYVLDRIAEIPAQWQRFDAELESLDHTPRETYGVVRGERGRPMLYTCGVRAADVASRPGAWDELTIAPQLYAVFKGKGNTELMRRMMPAIWRVWLPASGRTVVEAPTLEFYEQGFDAEAGGRFEIRIPVAAL